MIPPAVSALKASGEPVREGRLGEKTVRITQAFKMALTAITASKMRSFLTMHGYDKRRRKYILDLH